MMLCHKNIKVLHTSALQYVVHCINNFKKCNPLQNTMLMYYQHNKYSVTISVSIISTVVNVMNKYNKYNGKCSCLLSQQLVFPH